MNLYHDISCSLLENVLIIKICCLPDERHGRTVGWFLDEENVQAWGKTLSWWLYAHIIPEVVMYNDSRSRQYNIQLLENIYCSVG